MIKKLSSVSQFRPRASHAVAVIAVCAAMGGTAYAANEWTGNNIVDSSLTGADIATASIPSSDLALSFKTESVSGWVGQSQGATLTAQCPAGKKALGGGHDGQAYASYPKSDNSGWVVKFGARPDTMFGASVVAYAQCAKVS